MPDIERPASFYDEKYKRTGWVKPELVPIHKYVIAELERLGTKSMLDIGCGRGSLLSLCHDRGLACYGFDFSPVAIKICRKYNKLENVWIGDIQDAENYTGKYDAYLAIEVLEHVIRDLDIIENLRPDIPFIFSVPGYANIGSGHVRRFKSPDAISQRYGDIIDIKSIERVGKRWVTIASTKLEGV